MSTVAERVARGAALLDEKDPGWWAAISLSALNIGSVSCCILGQRYHLDTGRNLPWWDYALILTGTDPDDQREATEDRVLEWARHHGFTAGSLVTDEWTRLTDEWTRVITERRAAA